MGYIPIRFDRKQKRWRYAVRPSDQRISIWQSIEAVVDFHAMKVIRVEAKPLPSWQIGWVETLLPVGVRPTRCSHVNGCVLAFDHFVHPHHLLTDSTMGRAKALAVDSALLRP